MASGAFNYEYGLGFDRQEYANISVSIPLPTIKSRTRQGAILSATELTAERYVRTDVPNIPGALPEYLSIEFAKLEEVLSLLEEAAIQVTDREPEDVRIGTVRYAVEPWDPLGDGSTGLVVYTSSGWTAL